MDHLNPQAREMADESMVRTVAAQADAIWPQEKLLFGRYQLPAQAHVLDAGCGTGEISMRIGQMFPDGRVLGIDIIDAHLDMARRRSALLGDRIRFENRSIFDLKLPDGEFDLVLCRHVLQSIPHADRAIAELVRVTRPGGWIHLIAEDYLMIHFEVRRMDPDDLWSEGQGTHQSPATVSSRISTTCLPRSRIRTVTVYGTSLLSPGAFRDEK